MCMCRALDGGDMGSPGASDGGGRRSSVGAGGGAAVISKCLYVGVLLVLLALSSALWSGSGACDRHYFPSHSITKNKKNRHSITKNKKKHRKTVKTNQNQPTN
jgi:hypothetical protein